MRRARVGRWFGRQSWSVGLALTILAVAILPGMLSAPAMGSTGPTRPVSESGIAQWRLVGSYVENSVTAGEGLTTITRGRGSANIVYRGILTVPKKLAAQGWTHIGDPDAVRGYIIDAFQGPSSGRSKMFLVTEPSGRTVKYVHKLVSGELYNNSFDAISPDTQWMVSGEWGTMRHLQIYPTPLLNRRTSKTGGTLRLAGYIKLDHKVNDIQGCDFTARTTLICASDDDGQKLFTNQKPLLKIELSRALDGASVAGHVTDLGSMPQRSTCAGTFEAEGVDYNVASGILRVEDIQPSSCIIKTTVYEYAHRGR
jgi:hypothetical protein